MPKGVKLLQLFFRNGAQTVGFPDRWAKRWGLNVGNPGFRLQGVGKITVLDADAADGLHKLIFRQLRELRVQDFKSPDRLPPQSSRR